MTDSRLGTVCEGISDDGAMALGVIALVAQERNHAGGCPSQCIEQLALRGKILAKISEEAPEITVFA